MLKFVKIVTYYAPIAFFAIFADLVASYGPQITEAYGRALLLYYPLCFVYIFTAFPLFAWFGGGKGAVKVMFRHIVKPAVVSLGTCSSVATIPIVLVAVLSSVGMSGVPGGGYIGEYIICSIFFPTQMEVAFPILVAIGNLVDPPATMINSAGDYVVSFIVSRFVDGKDWFQKQLAANEDR